MLMMCAIECVTGFDLRLFALGNLRYNPRVLVYEPCFLGYKAQTPFRRAAPAPFNNLPGNLAQGETKVFPLTRMDVRTTGNSGSHQQLQIGPAFGKPQLYHIRNIHDGHFILVCDT
jgi:hypothetical protein